MGRRILGDHSSSFWAGSVGRPVHSEPGGCDDVLPKGKREKAPRGSDALVQSASTLSAPFPVLRLVLCKDLRFYKSAARNERGDGDEHWASRHSETSLKVGGEATLAAHLLQLQDVRNLRAVT